MSAPAKTPRPADAAVATLPIRTKDAAPQRKPQQKRLLAHHQKPTPANTATLHKPKPRGRPRDPLLTQKTAAGQIAKIPTTGEKKKSRNAAHVSAKASAEKAAVILKEREGASTWKLSPFLGGRYAPLEPVFTRDEKNILVAQALSLKTYSTKTSLLVRTITIRTTTTVPNNPSDYIVSYFLDPRTDDRAYIATTSRLFLYNLTNGDEVGQWNLPLGRVQQACVCMDQELGKPETEAVFVVTKHVQTEIHSLWRVGLSAGGKVGEKVELFRSRSAIISFRAADAGRAICLISGKDIVVINANGAQWLSPRVYKMSNPLTCMDIQIDPSKKGKKGIGRCGDIVVGDIVGAIYILPDVIKYSKVEVDRTPRKLHWHRVAVSSVKWALDGAYIVSGGSETVLVIWQLATGHKQFLPHLGAAIKNIVISPQGSSYAVSLSDNSVMILSTSELKPKANIAGIQSHAQIRQSRESRAVPCLLHPTKANLFLIASPSNQLDQSSSAPYLQTFDTYSDRHISRQALTRTNATILNQGPDKARITEPDITFLAATSDGQWLASVDEWQPSKRNILDKEGAVLNLHTSRKREVFLKFWRWSEARKEWELITRVDAPHPSPEEIGAESILDLVAAPNGQTFITVGTDGCVKIWKPKMRVRPGATVTENQVTWGFRKSVNFAKRWPEGSDALPLATLVSSNKDNIPLPAWGKVAFSEDSSVLAVSYPGPGFGDGPAREDSILHLIDPASGTIRQTLGGLLVGRTTGLTIVDRYLVVAGSQKLLVWNLVHSRVEWEYTVAELSRGGPTGLHLAVDHREHSVAIAFSLAARGGKILVWQPVADANPALVQELDAPVAALKSAGVGKGFVVLDVQARVQYVTPVLAAHASVATIVASGQQVEEEDSAKTLSGMYIAVGEAMEIDDGDGGVERGQVEKVVARERLEEVFDGFEAYEQGAVEAAFERVMELFAKRPLVGDNDDEEEEEEEEESGSESEEEEEEEEEEED